MADFSSKKGQFGNIFIVIMLLFLMSVGGLVLHFTLGTVTDAVVDGGVLEGDALAMAQEQQTKFPVMMDGLVLLGLVIFILLMIFAASTADSNPVFFAILLILYVGVLVTVPWISNAYDDIASDNTLAVYANDLPLTNFIIGNLLEILVVLGVFTVLIAYSKIR